MSQNPWWHPSDDDLGWDEPLPVIIRLAPDYSAPFPLWGEGFGNIDWRYTKFPPALLDRLAAWQQEFDDNYATRPAGDPPQPGTGQLAAGRSIRTVQVMKTVLSSALSRAMREELVVRNVARLAELPTWERKPITPWSAAEARAFLEAAKNDPLYPAF